jgi:hypothetical protein
LGDGTIASGISKEFVFPVGEVGFWAPAVFGTSMPETAVDEDDEALGAKGEIGLAEERHAAAPASDSVGSKNFGECEFCVFVTPAANLGHDARTLFRGEYVGHEMIMRLGGGSANGTADGGWILFLVVCCRGEAPRDASEAKAAILARTLQNLADERCAGTWVASLFGRSKFRSLDV